MCCEGRGGRPGKHGVLKLFSSSFLGEFETRSGSVCPHSGCMCCEGGGAALLNMGLLKVFSSCFLREIEPHSGSVYTHSGCCL